MLSPPRSPDLADSTPITDPWYKPHTPEHPQKACPPYVPSGLQKNNDTDEYVEYSAATSSAALTQQRHVYELFTDSGYQSHAPGPLQKVSSPCVPSGLPNDETDEWAEYSAAASTAPLTRQKYIYELCQDLRGKALGLRDVRNWDNTLHYSLTALLKAFAIKIGHGGSPECLQIMHFIYQYSG